MKALVTGASGFIGSTLIEQLSSLGFEVYALMRKTSSPLNLNGIRYHRVEGDLSDIPSLKKAALGMDYVFHLAGATAAPDRESYFEANAYGSARLIQAVAESQPGLKRFVHVSSLAAAGPAASIEPRKESEPENPVSFYGQSKLQGEREVLKFKSQVPVVIVRPPMVYGPRDRGVLVIIQTVAKGIMPILGGSGPGGNKFYSAIHAEDLCRGIIQAALAPPNTVPSGEIFYLTDDGLHAYRDFLGIIAECLEKEPFAFRLPLAAMTVVAALLTGVGAVVRKTFPLNMDKLNELKPDFWICSSEKAKHLLGFKPELDLRTGMAQTIAWYKKQGWL